MSLRIPFRISVWVLKPVLMQFGIVALLLFMPLWINTAYTEEPTSGDYSFLQDGPLEKDKLDQAAAYYQELLTKGTEDFNAYFRLIEALYLKGHFLEKDSSIKKKLFARLVKLSKKTQHILEQKAKVPNNFSELSLQNRAEHLRDLPQSAQVHFWAAVNWGLWGMSHGYLASATKGVASKIREHTEMVILLDSKFADGGGYRILGRMHTVTPRIPFFTGWIDRQTGITLLRKAFAVSQEDPRNGFFLSEALLDYQPKKQKEALKLLKEVTLSSPRRTHWAEDRETIALAKALLQAQMP